jgi:hypothetical protein
MLWALAWSTLLVFAVSCDSTPAAGPSGPEIAGDSLAAADSLRGADSLGSSDSVPPADSPADSLETAPNTMSHSGVPFGPFDLFQSWDAPEVSGFAGAVNYASPDGIVTLLNNMRAHKIRGFLKLTGDHQSAYMTGGKFDFDKWKRATAKYDNPTIKTAIKAAVADGTLLGYSMIDEPNRFNWGRGSINKAMLDRMARYSKSLFPTLPTAAVVTYYWRPNERYRVLDAIISQTWAPTKSAATYRREAVAAARQNGVALAFALNILSGPKIRGCRKYGRTCIMTPRQVKQWATTLGPSTCGMFMWKYHKALYARSDYKRAFKEVAARLARESRTGCRRTG